MALGFGTETFEVAVMIETERTAYALLLAGLDSDAEGMSALLPIDDPTHLVGVSLALANLIILFASPSATSPDMRSELRAKLLRQLHSP